MLSFFLLLFLRWLIISFLFFDAFRLLSFRFYYAYTRVL